jgi:hypothetical protein
LLLVVVVLVGVHQQVILDFLAVVLADSEIYQEFQ